MKLVIIVFVILQSANILKAQTGSERTGGIGFIDTLSWSQVKAKAKMENKIIFLDVYATWCGPCKQMDTEVYTNKEVGDFFNANFVPIKVQVDQTSSDSPKIKAWYADANYISKHYETRELPSFLFLDGEGNLVHRDLGFKNAGEFLLLGKMAIDPAKSFVALSTAYQQGKLALEKLGAFAMTADAMQQKELSKQVAKDYKSKFLDNQTEAVLTNTENVLFVKNFPSLLTTKDPYFKLLLKKPKLMDSVLDRPGIAGQLVDYIITNEELIPVLWEENKPRKIQPDWEQLRMQIAEKYTKPIADRIIRAQQMSWYKSKEDWPMTVKYNIEKIDKEGLDTVGLGKTMLNNMIFNIIFKHSSDPVALKKAAKWMEILIKTQPDRYSWIDTYSGVLYKAGKKKKAIAQEEKAVWIIQQKIETVKDDGNSAGLLKKYKQDLVSYQKTLDKMKQDLPIWED